MTDTLNNVDIQETPQTNPWDNAPTGVIFYDKIYENGRLGTNTQSAAMAYKLGFDIEHNYISINDVQWSDLDGKCYRKELCPMKDLTEKKQDKLAELSMITDQFEQNKCDSMYVVSSLGFRANADRRSLQNVSNLIDIGVETQFKDYDNQFHLLSVADLETLALEIKKNGANLYTQKFTMQYQISNLSSEQEIENFEIRFEMMDFSEV